jgi:hypothetical protein
VQLKPIYLLAAAVAAAAAVSTARTVSAETKGHRFAAQDKGHVAIIGTDGRVEWEVPCRHNSHDLAVLPNGNVLVHDEPAGITEYTPDKKVVWQWRSRPAAPYSGRVEIHAFQRLKNDITMIAETGNKRIIEVDKSGAVIASVPLKVDNPDPHRDTRRVRKLPSGNYLVAHEGDGCVREYDKTGRVVWEYKLDLNGLPETETHRGHGTKVYSALRLKNGNTLIGGGNNNRVFEVTREGKIVWSIEQNELPGIKLTWITGLEVLPNGHILVVNTHGGEGNPQMFEVTRDKKVVWTYGDWNVFGDSLCAVQTLDTGDKVIR